MQHELNKTTLRKMAAHAAAIKRQWKRNVAGGVEIGRRLQAVKDLVGHGSWLEWLEREFEWSESTALRFMQLYKAVAVDKSVKMTDLARLQNTVATLVVAPSTPQAARNEIVERAKQGEHIGVSEARGIIIEKAHESLRPITISAKFSKEPTPTQGPNSP